MTSSEYVGWLFIGVVAVLGAIIGFTLAVVAGALT